MSVENTSKETLREKATRIARENPEFVNLPAGPQPLVQFPAPSTNPTFSTDWKPFTFVQSYRESFEGLRMAGFNEQAYMFLEALVVYGTTGVDINDDPLVAVALAPAKRLIDAHRDAFNKDKKNKSDKNNK